MKKQKKMTNELIFRKVIERQTGNLLYLCYLTQKCQI